MSAGSITVSSSGGSVTFTRFSDTELPSSYMAQASLEFSQIGTAYASGPARKQRKMWSISVFVTISEWNSLVSVYESWDQKRSQGGNLAVATLYDNLLGVGRSYSVFFTEPPNLSKLSGSNNTDFLASFVVVEV